MPRPNPTWSRRPRNRPWTPDDDAQLIEAVQLGVMIECAAPIFEGHDFGDVLHRRMELIKAGAVQLREPL